MRKEITGNSADWCRFGMWRPEERETRIYGGCCGLRGRLCIKIVNPYMHKESIRHSAGGVLNKHARNPKLRTNSRFEARKLQYSVA